MASDHARKGPRSSRGTPNKLPITSTGTAAAKSAIRSALPLTAMASMRPSTNWVTGASMSARARGVKAPAMSRRTRVQGRVIKDKARRVVLVEQALAKFGRELAVLVGGEGGGVLV